MPRAVYGTCFVNIIVGATSLVYNLPLDLDTVLQDILSNIATFRVQFSLFDDLAQTVESDQMLEDMLGGDRAIDSEIAMNFQLGVLKHTLFIIRLLEALYKVRNPNYISNLESVFVED
jgi:hypothetical protein